MGVTMTIAFPVDVAIDTTVGDTQPARSSGSGLVGHEVWQLKEGIALGGETRPGSLMHGLRGVDRMFAASGVGEDVEGRRAGHNPFGCHEPRSSRLLIARHVGGDLVGAWCNVA